MKTIRILTLIILVLGFNAVSAQQNGVELPKSDVVPVTDQFDNSGRDASQPPETCPEVTIASPVTVATKTDLMTQTILPGTLDASMPPPDEQDNLFEPVNKEMPLITQPQLQGRTAEDPPIEEQPIK